MKRRLAFPTGNQVSSGAKNHQLHAIAVAALVSATLSACAVVPSTGPAPQPVQAAALVSAQSLAAPKADWPAADWWTGFGDPQLDALMTEALEHSPSLVQAEARVRDAASRTQATRAALYPALNANASIDREKLSYNYIFPKSAVPRGWNDMGEAELDFSWELDFWSKNRKALRAATSEAQATAADAAAARVLLTTSLAGAYIQLEYQFERHDIAAETLRNRQDTARLIQRRAAQGLETRVRVEQAAARLETATAAVAEADEQIALARNGIAALLGQGPDRGRDIERPVLAVRRPLGLPTALAADLLGRNPEVVAARWRVEAAAQRVGVARAAFYPNVNLVALIGYQSLGLSNLFRSGSDIGGAGPALDLPLFDGGRLRAHYRGARAEYDLAVASYDQTLTLALRDTADATRSLFALRDRVGAADAALDHREESYRLAKARYQGGLDDDLAVLSTEDAVLTARLDDMTLHIRGYALDVALVKALGGGFESRSTFETQVQP